MRTYRELLRAPEYLPLLATASVQVAAQSVAGPAVGTLVLTATGSPLLAALAMFGPALAQVVGAGTLLAAADRLPPRAALSGLALYAGLGTAAQAVPGLPVWAVFAVLLALGLPASLGGGVRYGLLHEILAREGYLLGRSVLNMAVGTMQIAGFAVGGALLAVLSPRGTLLVAAALYLAAAGVGRLGLSRRPPRAAGRPSAAGTLRTTVLLWSSRPRRLVYLALWVPNGLVVGCESLYVSYAPRHAGLLLASAAAGMLAGETWVGRFLPRRWRERSAVPLQVLLAAPYLLFLLRPSLPWAVAAVAVASAGYAASLLWQERLMSLVPRELSGHALGLHTSGMLAMQGVGAAVAGTAAEASSPAAAMVAMSGASLAVTLALAAGLRTGRPARQAPGAAAGACPDAPHPPAGAAGGGLPGASGRADTSPTAPRGIPRDRTRGARDIP